MRKPRRSRAAVELLLFLMPAIVVFEIPGYARCDDDPALRQAFLKEVPTQWEEYLKFAAQLCGTGEYRVTYEGKTDSHLKIEIRQNSSCKLFGNQFLVPNRLANLSTRTLHNRRYAFELRKKRVGTSWVVTKLATEQPLDAFPEFDDAESGCRDYSARLLSLDFSHPLPELLRGASFRLLSVSRVNLGGASLVKVAFECPHPPEEKPKSPVQAGTIVLDPENHWVLRQTSLQCKSRMPNGQANVYLSEEEFQGRPYKTGFLVPVSYTQKVIRDKSLGGPSYERSISSDLSVPDKPPDDDEFTQSAYGLPEPQGLEPPSRSRWYLWVLGLVLVSFVVGYGLRKIRRKQP